MSIQMIEARHCSLSRLNVRKSPTDPVLLAQLKADIAARGVLQNLVGMPVPKKTGKFEIIAGGRRLAQVQALIAEGVFPKSYAIPVLVHDGAAGAAEISLAENLQREAMNPADACLAFRHCVEVDGASVDDVARRFGVTSRFVEGRLRLATLAPCVFEALRDGQISLEVAKAYGTTPDHARQEAVFAENQRWKNHSAGSIRRQMVDSAVTGSDRLAKLVGRDAYLAAGGRIEADLFGNDDELWLDAELLNTLAQAKLAAAAAVTTGYGKVVPVMTSRPIYDLTAPLRPVFPERLPMSEADQQRLAALETQVQALHQAYDALDEEDEDAAQDLADQIDAAEAEMSRLMQAGVAEIPAETRAQATAFLVVDADGSIAVHDTIYLERSAAGSPEPAGGRAAGAVGDTGDETGPTLSRSLGDELAVQRRELLAIHLAHNAGVALDVLLFALADAERRVGHGTDSIGVGLSSRMTPRGAFDFKVTGPLAEELGRLNDRLDRSWQEHRSAAARFDAFCALVDEQRAAWAGWIVARSLDATLRDEAGGTFHNHLGRLLGIDVAAWWRPTAENYWGRVKKEAILAALEAIGGSELKSRYAAAKKAELATAAEKIVAGKAIVEPQIKAAALAWVPDVMSFADSGGGTAQLDDPDTAAGDGGDQGADAGNDTGAAVNDHEVAIVTQAAA